jgi:hypothetical protein
MKRFAIRDWTLPTGDVQYRMSERSQLIELKKKKACAASYVNALRMMLKNWRKLQRLLVYWMWHWQRRMLQTLRMFASNPLLSILHWNILIS